MQRPNCAAGRISLSEGNGLARDRPVCDLVGRLGDVAAAGFLGVAAFGGCRDGVVLSAACARRGTCPGARRWGTFGFSRLGSEVVGSSGRKAHLFVSVGCRLAGDEVALERHTPGLVGAVVADLGLLVGNLFQAPPDTWVGP